jgi:D-alanine-D-alanine ligase
MRIGITFDLKAAGPSEPEALATVTPTTVADASGSDRPQVPDDLQEEYDSPATIEAIAAVLRGLGHDVVLLGDGREFLERVLADPPDFVFNIAEGHGVSRSREARVPAVLEMLGIPYSGSDPLTLAVTLDKDCAKRLVASAGVTVPPGVVLEPPSRDDGSGEPPHAIHFPAIVKPAWEGSSKGIRNRCLVRNRAELSAEVESLWRDHRQPLLVEEFIVGDELTVGVIGNDPPQVVGVMRVVPNRATPHFIYSLEVKRDFRQQVRYECPAKLSAAATVAVERAALTAYRALGCRDVARVDFRLRDGVPYFLEVNPLPGLSPDSGDLVIMTVEQQGWTYAQLVEKILRAALERHAGATCRTTPT